MSTANQKFSATRTFKAPKTLVFQAFANEAALAQWWGPVAAPIDVITLDFKPGGIFHYRMKGMQVNYGIFHYKEIVEPDRIVWVNSFANEHGEIIRPPFEGIDIPKEILNTITFTESDGITTLMLESEPIRASEKEIADFIAIRQGMEQGFGGTFDQLGAYLEAVQQ